MKRIVLICLILSVCCAGCSSDQKKLERLCAEIQTVSQMTSSCDKMAAHLRPLTDEYLEIMSRLSVAPSPEERLSYVDVVSKCLRGYLEISTGTCKDSEAVKDALPRDMQDY